LQIVPAHGGTLKRFYRDRVCEFLELDDEQEFD